MNVGYIILGVVVALLAIGIIIWVLKKMKGSIEIIPEKYSYSSGETINGKLTLKLKKPAQATKLIVGLKCERTEKNFSVAGRGTQSRTSTVFDFNQPLEGIKAYAPSDYSYNFSIKIPQNVSQKLEGTLGQVVKTAQVLMGQNTSAKWYLYSELQCDGVNISKKIQINIG